MGDKDIGRFDNLPWVPQFVNQGARIIRPQRGPNPGSAHLTSLPSGQWKVSLCQLAYHYCFSIAALHVLI